MAPDRELSDFVRQYVPSVWALELLLALYRDPARCWTPAQLVAELRASAALVNDNLARFERGGLAILDDGGCYRYAAANPALDLLTAKLELAYKVRPVAIINLIARPADPLQSLADAFKFKGDGK